VSNVTGNQSVGQLALLANKFEPVRFEFGTACVAAVQSLSVFDELADRFL
jgi:hypothetical protein